jgi:hypothetical protein
VRLHRADRYGIGKSARAGDWGQALDALLTALINASAPISTAERDELTAMLEAAGRPAAAAARLRVSAPGADVPGLP